MKGRAEKCKQGCCATPFGVCAKKGVCSCHMAGHADLAALARREALKQRAMRHADEIAGHPQWK